MSKDMAEVRARVALKVGAKSDIDAEILSFRGLESNKEHVAVVFKAVDKQALDKTPLCPYAF